MNAQQKKTEEPKVIKEVDQVDKKAEEVNETTNNTNTAIKNTVENSKETLKTIGSLFGSGKGKANKKSKGAIKIDIKEVTYDDERLNNLYTHISNAKGVKKASKNFSNGKASINVVCKENADTLWDGVPKNVRNAFKMLQIDDKSMVLELAAAQLAD